MQSKLSSLIEAALNTLSGFIISIFTSIIVFPFFGVHLSVGSNVKIVMIFTAVSIVRSYFWRRFFNRIHSKQVSK